MKKMYVLQIQHFMSGEDTPFTTSSPAVSSNPDKLVNSLREICKMHGAEAPHYTDFGWSFGYDGYHFLATVDEVNVI